MVDNEAIYDEEISPLVQRVIEICKRENVPFVMSFALREVNEGRGGIYCLSAMYGRPGMIKTPAFETAVAVLRATRIGTRTAGGAEGNECWYYRERYAGMGKVCMKKSIVECGRIVRYGRCPVPPDSEEWRRCGWAIGQVETAMATRRAHDPDDHGEDT